MSAFAFVVKRDAGKGRSPRKGWARRQGSVRTRTGVTGRQVRFLGFLGGFKKKKSESTYYFTFSSIA